MTQSINQADIALPIPITEEARRLAQQFARQQPTAQKAEQVRLNTLAVVAVHEYLQMMAIPTDLGASDSWNPVVRLCADTADLVVPAVGRLECRSVNPGEAACIVPPEVWEDRVGYVVIQIDPSLQESVILGFTPTATVEALPIAQLQSPEALLEHLHNLMQLETAPQQPVRVTEQPVNLSQWLQGAFETGWQTVEALLSVPEPNFAWGFRGKSGIGVESRAPGSQVQRAKLIDFGPQLGEVSVALVVELNPTENQPTDICLQVHPISCQPYLPPDLQLVVRDQSGATFLEAQSRQADNYIQLQFRGHPGEQFSVEVGLDETRVIESFVI